MSFDEKDLTGDISGLGTFELDALQDREYKFMEKYVKVGTIKSVVSVTDAESTGKSSESTPRDVDAIKPTEVGYFHVSSYGYCQARNDAAYCQH